MSQTSDFNLKKLTTKEAEENVRRTIEFGGNIVLIARRGSGKTSISKQVIPEMGCEEVYLNLSVMERPDLGGFPNFHSSKDYVDYLLPGFFRKLCEGDKPVVALLDEVDKAESALWAPLLEFTQFRTMNGKPLKNLKAIIMTGNLVSEGGQRPSLPLLDRAEKYLMEADIQSFTEWGARTGEIHPSISAYLNDHPDDLFGDVDPGELYADTSPRGWHNASKILTFGEKAKWSPKVLTDKVSGCIGKKVGIKYESYFEHYQILLPVVDKMMKGEAVKDFGKLEATKQVVACMIACSRMARMLDASEGSKQLPKEIEHLGNFFVNNVEPEIALISLRSQVTIQRIIKHSLDDVSPAWDKIISKINNQIKVK